MRSRTGVLDSPLLRCCQSRFLVALWVLLSIAGMVVTAARISAFHQTPGPFDPAMQGFCDFHNGIYFPSLAYSKRISPYSQAYADAYPVSRQVPPYSPLIIALHVPFALMPLAIAEVCYFVLMIVCVIAIAWILVRDATDLPSSTVWACIWPVVTIIVWSRPGHVALFNGYFTFELVLGTFVALSFARSRPWLAALGIALASGKPTYFLPLIALMMARGDYAATIRGVILSTLGGFFSMLWVTGFSFSGIQQILNDVLGGQSVHMNDPLESPVTSWVRIDVATVLAKMLNRDLNEIVQIGCMIFLLVVPSVILWRHRRRFQLGGVTDLSGSLIVITSIVAIYHNSYDAILLMAPLVGWACMRWERAKENHRLDLAIILLLLVPIFNPFSTYAFLQRFEVNALVYQVVTSSNAIAIFIAGVMMLGRISRCDTASLGVDSGKMQPEI